MRIPHHRFLPVTALLAAAATALGAPPAFADDPKPTKRGSDGFHFSPPESEPPVDPGAKEPEAHAPTKAQGPVDPLVLAIRQLSTWPGQDGRKAAETLLLRGPESVPYLINALDPAKQGDPSVRPGAAWVLGKVGAGENVPLILRAAAERQNGSRLEVFFEAAHDLDPAIAKRWLFSYLTVLERPVFRSRATDFLATILAPEDREKVDKLLNSPLGGVKIAGLQLLAKMKAPDVSDRLVDALSDINPEVSKRATQLIASIGDETLLPRLNSLAREGDARQRAYATLTLVEYSRTLRKNVFEPATVTEMIGRRGLNHPAEKLCRGAAAVGLVFGALDSTDAAVGPLLDDLVVNILIDTVGGDHFRDFASLSEPVFAALKRLSGLDLASSARAWASWWQEQRGKFRARRLLGSVADTDIQHARVIIDAVDAEGRRRRVTFIAEAGDPVEGAYILPRPAFTALLNGVEDSGLFQQPDDPRTLSEEHLGVRVGVMNQEKRILLVASKEDGRYAMMKARVEALEQSNLWQRYRDTDQFPDATAWWRRQSEFYASADPEVRRQALRSAIVFSFDDLLTDSAKSEALDRLETLGEDLTDAEANHLIFTAAQASALGAVEVRALGFVAGLRRPALRDALIEALSGAVAPAAADLLATSLADSGPVRVREAFADPRPAVRSAGASAALTLLSSLGRDDVAKKRLGEILSAGLRALLADPEPRVQVRAAAALGVIGDPDALPKLQALFEDGDTGVRIAVAESLGRIGGTSVHPLLIRIVDFDGQGTAPIRAAAVHALAASNHPNAVRLLGHFLLNDADPSVQDAAREALISLGTEEARFSLVDLLTVTSGKLESEKRARIVRTLAGFDGAMVRETLGRFLEDLNPAVVTEAALGLARQNEAVAVPYLIAVLKRAGDPSRQKALEEIEAVTSLALSVHDYETAADQYEAWYSLHREGGDRAWFRDALQRRGYDGPALAGYVHGDADLKAVPVLLRTIRDDDPVIRRNSDVALRRISGRTFGAVDRATPREEAVAVADRWSAWWSRNNPNSRK